MTVRSGFPIEERMGGEEATGVLPRICATKENRNGAVELRGRTSGCWCE